MDPEAAGKVIGEKRVKPKKGQWTNLLLVATLVVIVAAVAIWSLYSRLAPPSTGVAPDQPTIAVLPFENMSDDPKQVYFADGMTDDLITGLSKISGLFVIARNSTFTYKGKPVKVQQVADELGVRYVVEGSVRRVGDQVRINAQLIDATTGYHLWAEHYDGTLDDIFALQDRINQQIISALAVQLTAGEQSKLASKETSSIEAYDAFLQGWEHYLRRTPEDFAKALPYFKKAIELDKNYGRAYAALALTYWNSSIFGWSKSLGVESSSPARILAREYVEIALKHPTSIAHRVASDMSLHRRNYGEALAEAKRAIAYDPNDAESHVMMGRVLICIGRPEEAIDFLEKAMLLDPRNLAGPLGIIGLARFCTGELQEAVIQTERALKHNPDRTGFASILAVAYAYLGQDQKAQTALASYIKTWGNPPHLPQVMYAFPFKNTEVADRFAEGLLRAGLPGKPSGYYKVSEEHKLTGEEFRSLFFGRRLTGFFVDNQWSIDRTKDGEATFLWNSAVTGVGRSWVEGNRLCNQWQKMFGGLKYCMDVFRNPDGTPEEKSEYLVVTDFGIFGCSTEELASETPDIL
jgi:TolB-like protein/thioredoxin-like negative regulator of GroEL